MFFISVITLGQIRNEVLNLEYSSHASIHTDLISGSTAQIRDREDQSLFAFMCINFQRIIVLLNRSIISGVVTEWTKKYNKENNLAGGNFTSGCNLFEP